MSGHNVTAELGSAVKVTDQSGDFTLTAAEHMGVFTISATDKTVTLPGTEQGLQFTFVILSTGGSTGFSISPLSGDSINGGTDDKDLINTQGGDIVGDSVTVIGNGGSGWVTRSMHGIWAAEA